MTNKEAKDKLYLQWQAFLEDNIDYAGVSEAYKMAFKALEQEPYFWEKCPYYEPDIMFDGKEEYDMGKCTYKQEPCEDAISRQDALDCLTANGLKKFDFILDAREKIKNLPPVKPQEKTGHWIRIHFGFECSNCHKCIEGKWDNNIDNMTGTLFCPNCGAKMANEYNGISCDDCEVTVRTGED